jgi:hypothetical protein
VASPADCTIGSRPRFGDDQVFMDVDTIAHATIHEHHRKPTRKPAWDDRGRPARTLPPRSTSSNDNYYCERATKRLCLTSHHLMQDPVEIAANYGDIGVIVAKSGLGGLDGPLQLGAGRRPGRSRRPGRPARLLSSRRTQRRASSHAPCRPSEVVCRQCRHGCQDLQSWPSRESYPHRHTTRSSTSSSARRISRAMSNLLEVKGIDSAHGPTVRWCWSCAKVQFRVER